MLTGSVVNIVEWLSWFNWYAKNILLANISNDYTMLSKIELMH